MTRERFEALEIRPRARTKNNFEPNDLNSSHCGAKREEVPQGYIRTTVNPGEDAEAASTAVEVAIR